MNTLTFIGHGFIFSLLGIVTGLVVDSFFYRLYSKKHHNLMLLTTQILVNVWIMYVYIKVKKMNKGIEKWEFSLLALSFPSFFFNVQFHFFDRIRELVKRRP
jgi:hypothetical protein